MLRKTRLAIPLGFSALLAVLFFHAITLAASSFYDVPQDDILFSPYIERLYGAHLIIGDTLNGKPTYTFRPRDTISRAEFTKITVGVKLAEKYGNQENWKDKSEYEMTETVLKDKLLYFHKCDNSDVPQCAVTQGADITGVCNVCQLTNEKPFTDVKEKERDCEETDVCTPWYSEYVYYALRKGMVQGFKEGSSYAFHPGDSIIRIHALKLIMADSGAVGPEADERYRRLSQTAKARGAYFPKCLSGAEPYILKNNGGEGNPDAEKLLKYALLADELDFFGNRCQVFSTYGANTPQQKASFLQSTMTRQEVARYFVLSSSYSPLQIPPSLDPTVDEVVSELTDLDNPEKVDTNDVYVKSDNSLFKEDAINELHEDPMYLDLNKAEMPIHQLVAQSVQGRCCSSKSLQSCSTRKFSTLTVSEEPDEYLNGQVWYKAIQSNGSTCWVPYSDILSGYPAIESESYLTASLPTTEFRVAGFSLNDTTLKLREEAVKTLRHIEILKHLDEYYENHTADQTRAYALKGKTPGTDDYDYIEAWYQEKKKIEENYEKLGQLVELASEKIEVEVKKTLTGWERRAEIHNRLNEHYAKIHDLEATKRWGLTDKDPNHDDFRYVIQWYEIIIEEQRIQAEKDADYWGKGLVDGVNGFGAGVAGTTFYIIEVVDNGVVTPVAVMVQDGFSDPEKCFTEGADQMVYGEFTDKVNICGTSGQLIMSFTGVDAPADVRDVIASVGKGDVGGVFINGIGLLPVVGAVKNVDELGTLYKAASKLGLVRKGTEAIGSLTKKLSGAIPRQVITKLDELYYYAKIKKPQFDTKLSVVATEVGAKTELTDLKDYGRVTQKVGEDVGAIKDLVRGTLTFDDVDSLKAAFPEIQKHYDIVEIKDRIANPLKNGYQDINMVVKDKDGFLTEVRLSTKKMFEASKKEHPIYEIKRQFDVDVEYRSLQDIEEAVKSLKKESPDIYARIENDINVIIKHVDDKVEGVPEKSLDKLFDESSKIFKAAK